MSMKIWQYGGEKQLLCSALATLVEEPFYIFSSTVLSLLLPLCFLLLARLSSANNHPFTLTPNPHLPSLLRSVFSYSFSCLFHPPVFLISFATLVHAVTGWIPFTRKSTEPIFRSHLCAAWILLCTLQISLLFGVAVGISGSDSGFGFDHEISISLVIRVMFFLGLHETMLYWSMTVVKPVADDAIFGFVKEVRWVDRVVMEVGFCAVWWWRLRDEIEWLVFVFEVKKGMSMGVGVADFVGLWLYYQTVTIGLVRIVKGVIVILLCRRRVEEVNPSGYSNKSNEEEEEKV